MKNTKSEFRWFSISDWKDEEAYLERRHGEGWQFESVCLPGIYHFVRCEPEKVVYQLDYNKDGLDHQAEYVQMFADCGWEYIQDFAGYSYFRKPTENMKDGEEEIFCDNASRMEMMNRVFQGRVIPLIIIAACLIVQLLLQLAVPGGGSTKIFLVFLVLLVLYLMVFAKFAYQYWKLKKVM